MVETLATIMSHFSGEANRARCLAHIVNLVAKIILRQFDMSKKKKKKEKVPDLPVSDDADNNEAIVDGAEDDDEFDDEMNRTLDKEEKEMDEGDDDDDEESEKLERDTEIMEKVMEEEIERVAKKVKPVRQTLYKVRGVGGPRPIFYFLSIPSPSSFFFHSSIFYRSHPILLFFIVLIPLSTLLSLLSILSPTFIFIYILFFLLYRSLRCWRFNSALNVAFISSVLSVSFLFFYILFFSLPLSTLLEI
jgi:hypothetical protein